MPSFSGGHDYFRMERNFPKYLFIWILAWAGLIFNGCGVEQFTEPDYIRPVFGLAAYPHDGYLTIEFTSINSEQRFDGFNVYLSTSSEVASQGLDPLSPDGVLPTIPGQAVNNGSSFVVTWNVRKDIANASLVNGTTYYLVVRGHSTRGYLSDPCNETATTPRPESVTQVSLLAGDGYSLSSASAAPPWNFELVLTNALLYLRPLNAGSLKDEGYYSDPASYRTVQTNGFPSTGLLLQAVDHHVYILKTSGGNFGKIYLDSVLASSVRFRWAFQNNAGNLHI